MKFLDFFTKDIGIDLGTANTLIYVKGKGVVTREPSVVAINKNTNKVVAVGSEAKNMLGRTPGNIVAVRPLKDGVIADFDITQKMIEYFIKKTVKKFSFVRPRIVICIPSGITEVEKRAVEEAGCAAGAKSVYLIEEPMAAAIGAGLQVQSPTGNMVVDIGGGTSEVAIISLGGLVTSISLRVGGDALDDAIIQYIKRKHKLMIGERTAEKIKMEIGSAYLDAAMNQNKSILVKEDEISDTVIEENKLDINVAEFDNTIKDEYKQGMDIRGRDLISGLPITVKITPEEINEALREPVSQIINTIKTTLEKTPPELAADVIENGICLTGGGALLKGLDVLVEKETGVKAVIAKNPLDCVALGTGAASEDIDLLKSAAGRTNKRR